MSRPHSAAILRACLAVLICAALVTSASSSWATVPGANGQMVFAATENARPYGTYIYSVNPDGTGQRKLTSSGSEQNPFFSPDAAQIAYERQEFRNNDYDTAIWVMNADGSGQRRLTTNSQADETSPVWSPDGSRIAFVRYDHCSDVYCYPRKDIYALATDGSSVLQRLTNDPAHKDYRPAFSPDGRTIVFESPIGLTLMNADGSNRRLLSSRGGTGPQFSPDGTRIGYSLNGQLWTIGADGSGDRKLPNKAVGAEYSPAWGVRR